MTSSMIKDLIAVREFDKDQGGSLSIEELQKVAAVSDVSSLLPFLSASFDRSEKRHDALGVYRTIEKQA